MGQIYLDEVCRVAGLRPAAAPASPQEIRGRCCLVLSDEDVPASREPAGVRLDLPQLLERVYPDVRVRADGEPDIALQDPPAGRNPSPRFPSVVGQAHTEAPCWERRSNSLSPA